MSEFFNPGMEKSSKSKSNTRKYLNIFGYIQHFQEKFFFFFFGMAKNLRINKVKRQLINWEKIFVRHSTDKGLISLISKELLKMERQRTKNLMGKCEKYIGRQFWQEKQKNSFNLWLNKK